MKRFLTVVLFIFSIGLFAQSNQPWRSFYSYNLTKDLTQSSSRIYGAAENAVFYKNVLTNELNTITSVDGLKTETISAMHHSEEFNKTLVGNENGLLLVINSDNTIVNKVDIVQETTVQQDKKKINHIYEYQGKAYLSCDFGIAVFDLATLEFGDTYYMGPNGMEIPVTQCAVYNGYIYAATPQNGIRRGLFSNPNLNDYNQWSEFASGQFTGILAYSGNLFATNTIGGILRLQNDAFTFFATLPGAAVDLRVGGGYMVVTGGNTVNIYNQQLILIQSYNYIPGEAVNFTCATVLNEKVYLGTYEKGVYTTFLNTFSFENITPDGPLYSNIFSLEKTPNNLWAVYGAYGFYHTPDNSQKGISKLTPEGWYNIPFSDLPGSPESLSDIGLKPGTESPVYAASYDMGLLKITDDAPEILYDDTNTGDNGLESLNFAPDPSYTSIRINGPTFDNAGNLWMTNSSVMSPLKVFRTNGQWAEYSFEDITSSPQSDFYGRLVIDKNGTKWIPSVNNGIIAFNEGMGNRFVIVKGAESNLPTTYVRCLAIDKRNQLWIGTIRGLRVLPSVDRFTTDNQLTTNAIIILEDGVAQELMYEQVINEVVVDGANNKWIATAGAGAFLVSPNGQETLAHFTKDNSPLPSNEINDIELDPVTGEVFFATAKGMVSFLGNSTAPEGDLNNVYVFPNPVRPGFEGDVNISGLMDRVNLKITDIEGNLVYETTSQGGTVLWDTRAFGKYKVASGVYMIFISSEDGTQTKVKKVMIIRGE